MTVSGLRVREAAPADLPALAELERAAFGEPWSRAGLAAFIGRTGALVLLGELPAEDALAAGTAATAVEAAGRAAPAARTRPPAAYAAWTLAAGEAELLRLAVDPARRRQGIAREILAAGAKRLAAAGCSTCFLEVRADNRAAIALYERAGFHRIGHRTAYYRDGSDALLYGASVGRRAGQAGRGPSRG